MCCVVLCGMLCDVLCNKQMFISAFSYMKMTFKNNVRENAHALFL